MFRQHLVDKRTYFEKLKELVVKEEWDEFVLLFYLSVSPARRAPHPNQATIGFTTLSVPLTGDRNPSRKGKDVTALQCCGCPTCPSPGGGSLTHSQALALSKRARDVTALRCSEPLRFMVGGASKPSPCFAGWDRRGIVVYS